MSLEALSNAIHEINEFNLKYAKLEDALDKHAANWMDHHVRTFSKETDLNYAPKFIDAIEKINEIVEGLIPKDKSLFLLSLPLDRPFSISISTLQKRQNSLGELYKENYKSIVGQSAKLSDLLKVKYTNQKAYEKKIKKYCYISLVCWFVLGICFYNPSRL
jgi:hypothetical protein